MAPVRRFLSTKTTVMQHWSGNIRQSGKRGRELSSVFTLYVDRMILDSGINIDICSLHIMFGSIVFDRHIIPARSNTRRRLGNIGMAL